MIQNELRKNLKSPHTKILYIQNRDKMPKKFKIVITPPAPVEEEPAQSPVEEPERVEIEQVEPAVVEIEQPAVDIDMEEPAVEEVVPAVVEPEPMREGGDNGLGFVEEQPAVEEPADPHAVEDDWVCSICMCGKDEDGSVITRLACGDAFHNNCIRGYFITTGEKPIKSDQGRYLGKGYQCPNCREKSTIPPLDNVPVVPVAPVVVAPTTAKKKTAKPAVARHQAVKLKTLDDAVGITIQQRNPKRSQRTYDQYEAFKSATTIGEFKRLGGTKEAWKWDFERGYIKFANNDTDSSSDE